MSKMKDWFAKEENKQQVSVGELKVILKELDSNAVSIKASNVFPISYGTLADVKNIKVNIHKNECQLYSCESMVLTSV